MARGALSTALSSAVLPLTSLATGPLLARFLGPEQRGEMAAVLAPLFVLSFVASLALPEATAYAVARLKVPLRRAAAVATGLLLAIGSLAGVALWFAAPVLLRTTPDGIPVLRTAVFALPLVMVLLMQRAAVSGAGGYGRVGLERVTAALLRLLGLVLLALLGAITATTAVWCNIGSGLLAGLLLTRTILRSRSPRDASTLAPAPLARFLLGYAARGSGGVFSNLISWRLDLAVLPAFVGPANLGYYAVAVSLAEIPSLVLGATRSVVMTEAAARGDAGVVARASRVLVLISTGLVAGIVVVAPFAVVALFGRDFAPAVDLARILLLGAVPFTLELILGAGLLALGRPGLRSAGQIVGAVLTIAGLVLTVPRLGTTGAALTSLFAYSASCTVTLVLFSRTSGQSVRACLLPTPADVRWFAASARSAIRRRRPADQPISSAQR